MLWGRGAATCSFPDCKKNLFIDRTETDDETLIGEMCHIIAEADNGPRGDSSFPMDKRNVYENLILMCRNHHRIIDSQTNTYSIDLLRKMKSDHEGWIKSFNTIDPVKQRDDETYSGYIDEWEKRVHLKEWLGWSSWMLSAGQPRVTIDTYDDLDELRRWLLNRVWPNRYKELESAFSNFRRVLEDLVNTFSEHKEIPQYSDKEYFTRKFYKSKNYDENLYADELKMYNYHVDLVQDLMLELTRAANLICDNVRHSLIQSYRIYEGKLMIQSGPNEDLSYHEFVVEYSKNEVETECFYPGFKKYASDIRFARDRCFGSPPE